MVLHLKVRKSRSPPGPPITPQTPPLPPEPNQANAMGSQAYVLAIDQGTTSTRAILFDTAGRPRATAQTELAQYYPQPGWGEHDTEEIWQNVLSTSREEHAAPRGT